MIESAGACAVYLPPYLPDLNPIARILSRVTQFFRTPRLLCFRQITLNDIEDAFLHCGYDTSQIGNLR